MPNIPEFHVKNDSYTVNLAQLQKAKSTWRGKMVTIGDENHKIKVKYNKVLQNIADEMKPDEALALFKILNVNKAPGLFSNADGKIRRVMMNEVIERKYGGREKLIADPQKFAAALENGYNIRLLPSDVKKPPSFDYNYGLADAIRHSVKPDILKETMVSNLHTSIKKSGINLEALKRAPMIQIHVNRDTGGTSVLNLPVDLTQKDLLSTFDAYCSQTLGLQRPGVKSINALYSVLLQGNDGKFYAAVDVASATLGKKDNTTSLSSCNPFKSFENEEQANAFIQSRLKAFTLSNS